MARFCEPTEEQESGYHAWVKTRPPVVREIAERLEPWSLYRMKSTDQLVTLYSISEDGTVTVNVTSEFNGPWVMDRQVFGIEPDDLEPADLPIGEPVGGVQ